MKSSHDYVIDKSLEKYHNKAEKAKDKMFNGSLRKDEITRMMCAMARNGYSLDDIADTFDLDREYLNDFAQSNIEMRASLLGGINYAALKVEEALLTKALGATSEKEVWGTVIDDGGNASLEVVNRIVESHVPDTQAAIRWLEQMNKKRWAKDSILGSEDEVSEHLTSLLSVLKQPKETRQLEDFESKDEQ